MDNAHNSQDATKPFAERVIEEQVGPCRLLMLPTSVDSVVTWRGSFCSYPYFSAGEDHVQDVMVSLLDKGTTRRDRFEVAEVLEERGAELNFNGKTFRIQCKGRALAKDVPAVLDVMAEQLRMPLFDPDEFQKAVAQEAGSVQRSMESTREQAAAALSRQLYDENHPNYTPEPSQQLRTLQSITPEAIQSFHQEHVGATEFILVFVGDLDEDVIVNAVHDCFADWEPHEATPQFSIEGKEGEPSEVDMPMPDKDSVDVRFGHTLPIRRDDDAYIPLYVGNYILGGNFSARLMATIRDEMGLTYGINAGLNGVATEHEGHWRIGVTLSQENLSRGVEATRQEIARFVKDGASADELDDKKTTITGSFKVGLASTGGLAGTLLRNAERGFEVAYLDQFPERVRGLSLQEVNEAVRRYFDPEALHVARAGQIEAAHAGVTS